MQISEACAALKAGRRLQVNYDDAVRVVEVHAVGLSRSGNAVMRAYQVRGGSNSGEQQGWKLMRLDQAHSAIVLAESSDAPRPQYKRNDSHMARIECQV